MIALKHDGEAAAEFYSGASSFVRRCIELAPQHFGHDDVFGLDFLTSWKFFLDGQVQRSIVVSLWLNSPEDRVLLAGAAMAGAVLMDRIEKKLSEDRPLSEKESEWKDSAFGWSNVCLALGHYSHSYVSKSPATDLSLSLDALERLQRVQGKPILDRLRSSISDITQRVQDRHFMFQENNQDEEVVPIAAKYYIPINTSNGYFNDSACAIDDWKMKLPSGSAAPTETGGVANTTPTPGSNTTQDVTEQQTDEFEQQLEATKKSEKGWLLVLIQDADSDNDVDFGNH